MWALTSSTFCGNRWLCSSRRSPEGNRTSRRNSSRWLRSQAEARKAERRQAGGGDVTGSSSRDRDRARIRRGHSRRWASKEGRAAAARDTAAMTRRRRNWRASLVVCAHGGSPQQGGADVAASAAAAAEPGEERVGCLQSERFVPLLADGAVLRCHTRVVQQKNGTRRQNWWQAHRMRR